MQKMHVCIYTYMQTHTHTHTYTRARACKYVQVYTQWSPSQQMQLVKDWVNYYLEDWNENDYQDCVQCLHLVWLDVNSTLQDIKHM